MLRVFLFFFFFNDSVHANDRRNTKVGTILLLKYFSIFIHMKEESEKVGVVGSLKGCQKIF